MIDFNRLLTVENILNKVSTFQIFKFYIPELNVGSAVCSPLRKDNNPSFSVFKTQDNTLLFKDFSTNESGDWVKLIKLMYNITTLNDVLRRVNQDMRLGLMGDDIKGSKRVVIPKHQEIPNSSVTTIKVHYRAWNDDDKEFWNKYGISIEQLINSNTFPIDYYWINSSQTIIADKLAYVYHFYKHEGVDRLKIYQPYSKKWKWTTNLDNTVVDGIKELQYDNNILIITKSRKDRLVINNLGYESISVNSERTFIPDKIFKRLNKIYSQIILFYDNDKTGIEGASEISNKYNISNISIPIPWKVKDISDFVKKYDEKLARELIIKLINNENIIE